MESLNSSSNSNDFIVRFDLNLDSDVVRHPQLAYEILHFEVAGKILKVSISSDCFEISDPKCSNILSFSLKHLVELIHHLVVIPSVLFATRSIL